MEKWVDQRLLADMIDQANKFETILVAYDFDNTISPYGDKDDPAMLIRSHELIREAKKQGHIVYCYTANPDLNKVRKFVADNDIPMDYLNESPPKGAGSKVPQGGAKLYYNIFLDDKCGLKSAQDTLEAFLMQESVEFDLSKAIRCHLGRVRAQRQCSSTSEGYKVLQNKIDAFRKLAVAAHDIPQEELDHMEQEALK